MAQLVKTVQGLAIASVKTVQGLAIASVKTINGLDNTSASRPDPGDYGTCIQALWGDDAPSGSVGTWPFDTYGSDATQSTAGAKPTRVDNDLNGHHTLSFDGDDWMTFTTVSALSVFVVFNHNDGDQDYAFLLGETSTAPLHGGAGTAMFNSAFSSPTNFATGSVYDNGAASTFNGMTKPTTFHLLSLVGDTFTTDLNKIATTAGQEVTFPARIWNGKIAAIFMFSDALGTTNRQNFEDALGTFFGITITH